MDLKCKLAHGTDQNADMTRQTTNRAEAPVTIARPSQTTPGFVASGSHSQKPSVSMRPRGEGSGWYSPGAVGPRVNEQILRRGRSLD